MSFKQFVAAIAICVLVVAAGNFIMMMGLLLSDTYYMAEIANTIAKDIHTVFFGVREDISTMAAWVDALPLWLSIPSTIIAVALLPFLWRKWQRG